jgi:vacuolar iron transporter family protein
MQESNLNAATDEAQSGGIRAAVLGINDGLVTNLALILGVAGGTTDVTFVKLAGLASLVAGACSMAVGEYVSMQAQVGLLQRVLSSVRRTFADEGERLDGLKRAFACEGLSAGVAATAAHDLGDDRDRAVDLFSRVVLGINPGELGSPWIAALASLVTFAIGALVPLVPWYVFDAPRATSISIALSLVCAFAIGALLGYHTDRRWLSGGIRQIFVIVLAAAITYGAGRLFHVSVG